MAPKMEMGSAEIYQTLNGIFRDVFEGDRIVLQPDLTPDEIEEWDSLSHIRLVLTVEKTFGIKFSASEIGKLSNVGDLVEQIQKKL